MTKAKSLGKIAVRSSALFLCDMQEKFRTTISYFPEIVQVAERMLKTADILDVPVVVTEQYPKGDRIPVYSFIAQLEIFF